jgi:hypothetical protein
LISLAVSHFNLHTFFGVFRPRKDMKAPKKIGTIPLHFGLSESGLFDNPPELAHQSSPERH